MRLVFVDTSGLYALADSKDSAHDRAVAFLERNQAPLLTSNYVFAECMSLLTKRLGKAVALEVGEGLRVSESLRIFSLTAEYEAAAWMEFRKYRDRDFDFVDSTSFVVMERQGIEEAFTFDRHFIQRGFRMVPGEAGGRVSEARPDYRAARRSRASRAAATRSARSG